MVFSVPVRRGRRVPTAGIATAALLAALLASALPATVAAAEPLSLGIGAGQGTVAGQVYAPGDVTVTVGTTVKWTWRSDEPHTLSFGPPPTDPVAGLPVTFPNKPPDAGPPAPFDYGTASYDGTGNLSTGISGNGSTAAVTFTKAGDIPFFCYIHPGMAGTVKVVASGTATTQAQADAAGVQTTDAILGKVDATRQAALDSVTSTERADGTRLWGILASAGTEAEPMPGGGTGYLELLQYLPPSLDIGVGDTVEWSTDDVHTVTFTGGADPTTLDPFTTPITTEASYGGSGMRNSGLTNIGPGSPSTYSLTFTEAGTFPYLCLLHWPLGQAGTINVSAADQAPPPTSTAPAPPGGGNGPPALPILALLALAAGGALLGYRRLARGA